MPPISFCDPRSCGRSLAISTLYTKLSLMLLLVTERSSIKNVIRLGERHSRGWLEKVNAAAQFDCLVVLSSGILNESFPWDQLNRHTESYLKKKGKIGQVERDKRLRNLIKKHGILHISVAACARFMSPESVKSLLADELKNATKDETKFPRFLQATVAAHHENPLAVTEVDSQLAQTLISYSDSDSATVSQKLEKLIKSFIAGIPSDSFAYSHICRLTKNFSVHLAKQVAALKQSGLWLGAHKETDWLSTLLDPSNKSSGGALQAIGILEGEFPQWKAWAEWSEQDSQLAEALIPCHKPDSTTPGQNLKILIKHLLDGIPTQSLLHSDVQSLARKFSKELPTKLNTLKLDGQWWMAYKEAECLSMLLKPSSELSLAYEYVIHLLDEEFASWRPWAQWRPHINRLKMQQRLTTPQRRSLLDLLALEGPDFEPSMQASMKEGLVAQHSSCPAPTIRWGSVEMDVKIEVADNARDMFERLSKAVAAGCRTRSGDLDLLIRLCCNSKPIDDNVLKILEGNNSIGNGLVTADVLHILEVKKEIQASQMAAVTRLLLALSDSSARVLREALAPYLVECISDNMREMQATLKTQLGSSKLVMQLHTFGKAVQAAQWLVPSFYAPLQTLIKNWPSPRKIRDMNSLRSDVRKATSPELKSLSLQIDEYYTECLIEPGSMNQQTKSIVESLINLWHQKLFSADKRAVALMIAQGEGKGACIRRDCLRQLPTLPDEFVRYLRQILERSVKEPHRSCVDLSHLFANYLFPVHKDVACWRAVLYNWLIDQDLALFEYASTQLTISEWYLWLSDLQPLFKIAKDPQIVPKVLRPELHDWAMRIRPYSTTIQKGERILGSGSLRRCFRAGFERAYAEDMFELLEFLKIKDEIISGDSRGNFQLAAWSSIAFLECDGNNSMNLRQAWDSLFEATAYGIDVYLRIIKIYRESSPEFTQVLLAGWLENPDFTRADREALACLGGLIGYCPKSDKYLDIKASAANRHVADEMTALRVEAHRLSSLRRSLKMRDPESASALCIELGIGDTSPLEDEIASLPHELVNLIEMVDDDVVELNFPLTHYSALQRAGMGIKSAQSLIVRLSVEYSSLSAGFCIHLDNELRGLANSRGHSSWLVLDNNFNAGTPLCIGQMNRATYQLARFLSRHLQFSSKTLEETYTTVKLSLDTMSESCIICGIPHGVRLRRSGFCQNSACWALYLEANLNIQLSEFREDTQVVDLLLTSVQAAVISNKIDLLPGLPGNDLEPITEVLSNLPPITTLRTSRDLHAALEHLGQFTLDFLKWMFCQYGGFLVSATGIVPVASQLRIPSMPGAYQFLLANAAPHLEEAFAASIGSRPTTVVFHGTSLDRLYAILCQGLQILSGTPLQKTGAVRGKGIYVAEEPRKSWDYAATYQGLGEKPGWNSGTFDKFRVLLACEASGITSGRDFHVITDPSSLILRYIFLIPTGMKAPLASHIVPAMTSVFASLRSGSL